MTATIHTPESFKDLLRNERARAHRKGGEFSVVLFELSAHVDLSKVIQPIILPAILKRIRKIDQVGFYDKNHIGLLLPNTAGEGARKMVGDLKAIHAISANISGCEFYVYP